VVERRLQEVVVVSGSGDKVVVVVESCSVLDTSHP